MGQEQQGPAPVQLRAGSAQDLRALHALDQLCYPPGIAYSLAEMRYYLARPGAVCIVAEDEAGGLAGFAIAHPARYGKLPGGHIVTIDVAGELVRRGVGTRLMAAVEGQLIAAGVRLLRLEVAVDNLGAQAFYRRLGFKAKGAIPGYYLGKVDAILMEKELQQPE